MYHVSCVVNPKSKIKNPKLALVLLLSWLLVGWQTSANGRLLITEVFYDTPGADEETEWVEIANVGEVVVDLSDWQVGDEETAGGGEGMMRFPDGAQILPGQALVVAQTAVRFRQLYGFNPDFEMQDSDTAVPDMRRYRLWADGDIGLANGGDELLLMEDGVIVDAINYGDSAAYFSPAIGAVTTGQSIERIPADCDTDSAADWRPQRVPTPAQITLTGECAAPINPALLEDLLPIGQIQGAGDVSPFVNQIVSFRGVVIGAYADRNAAGITFYTLFVQDIPGFEDGDPATSDGIGLFLGRERPSAQPGDQARVTGQVTEFFGFTELDDGGLQIQVESNQNALPDAIHITPGSDLERYEGMRVRLDGAAQVVGPAFSGCGFAVAAPDGPARLFRRQLDDPIDQILQILHTSDVDCAGFPDVKVGDRVEGLAGPLIYHFDQYKIVNHGSLAVTTASLPPLSAPPAPTAGQFTVATFNLENYFDSVDDTGTDAEPKPTAVELATKQSKLAYALGVTLSCPALVAVQEVENAPLLTALAEETAAMCGFTYQVTHRESADGRGIDVALLSDPERVAVQTAVLRQGCTVLDTGIEDETMDCPAGQQPLFSRPPLQVDVLVDGRAYILLVNHFKSKRGGEVETTPRRIAQAQHLLALTDGMERVILLGDFNDYEQSAAMQVLYGRFANALFAIPDAERYSFVFGGASQLIDGILLSPALADELVSAAILHVNADFPDAWGMDLSPERRPYRATDHDLPVVVMAQPALPADPAPTVTAVSEPPTSDPTPSPDPVEDAPSLSWPFIGGGTAVLLAILLTLIRRRK